MGIYWLTRFYSNIRQSMKSDSFIILGTIDPLINEADVSRGYVLAEELLSLRRWEDSKLVSIVTEEEITSDSWIVEYQWTSANMSADPIETRRFPVRIA